MKNTSFFVFFSFSFFFVQFYAEAQGCSDAGFCTINAFKPQILSEQESFKNYAKVGTFLGKADRAISVAGSYVEFGRQLSQTVGVDTKLTTLAQSGTEYSGYRFADLFINSHWQVNKQLKFTLGTKIPLSKANQTYKGFDLPMDYQSSLGTFDLVVGLGFVLQKVQFVAAFQQPLSQNNNRFLVSNFSSSGLFQDFQSTNKFQRSGDVLLRVSYPIPSISKLRITPSLLPIYHLSNDKFTDATNVVKEIVGSKGLTLNGNIYVDYVLNASNSVQLNVGMPFVVRDARPDGLTRSFIANIEYRLLF